MTPRFALTVATAASHAQLYLGGGYDYDPRCNISLTLRGEWYSREHGDDTFTTIEEVRWGLTPLNLRAHPPISGHSNCYGEFILAAVSSKTVIRSTGIRKIQFLRSEHTTKSDHRHQMYFAVHLQQ